MLERSENKRREVQMFDLEALVPKNHLVRKIDKAVNFEEIYPMVEKYYCQDNGRPAVDPVVLVKMVLLQH
ncbi:MAG: transposase, partial [Clostridiales bacterium]|nr:transposase [Clostridiales bacterium]